MSAAQRRPVKRARAKGIEVVYIDAPHSDEVLREWFNLPVALVPKDESEAEPDRRALGSPRTEERGVEA